MHVTNSGDKAREERMRGFGCVQRRNSEYTDKRMMRADAEEDEIYGWL